MTTVNVCKWETNFYVPLIKHSRPLCYFYLLLYEKLHSQVHCIHFAIDFPFVFPFPLSTKHVKTFKGAKQSHLKVFKLHVLQEYTMLNVPSPVKHKHIMNNLLHLCSLMFTCFHFICTYRSTVFCWCFFAAVLLTLKQTPNNQVMAVKHCTQQLSFVLYCFMLFDISNKPNSVSTSPLHK